MSMISDRQVKKRGWFRRGPWEMGATVMIVLGIVMMMQPFSLWFYSHSFLVILIGTISFIIFSHFPE